MAKCGDFIINTGQKGKRAIQAQGIWQYEKSYWERDWTLKELKEEYPYDSSWEGTKPDETQPSTGFAGGGVSRACWPDLSKAADRSRNISTAVWPESLALYRSSVCGAVTIKMTKRRLRGYTFSSRKATHYHKRLTPFSLASSDVLDLACVSPVFCQLEGKKLISWFLSSFIH